MTVTIKTNCDQENVQFIVGPETLAWAAAPVLVSVVGGTTTPDGHKAATMTMQSGAGVTSDQLTGINLMVSSVIGVVQSPEPTLPTAVALASPSQTVAIVVEKLDNSVPGVVVSGISAEGLVAHAWLTFDGHPIFEPNSVERYAVMAEWGNNAA